MISYPTVTAAMYAGAPTKRELTRYNRRWKSIARNLKMQGLDTVHLCAALMNTPAYTFQFLNQYQTNKHWHLALPHDFDACSFSLQDSATFFEIHPFFTQGTLRPPMLVRLGGVENVPSALQKNARQHTEDLYGTLLHATKRCNTPSCESLYV